MKGWGMQRIVQGRDLELHNIVVQNRAPIIVSLHNGTAERRGRPRGGGGREGGTPIHYIYGYVPPNGVVILKLLI